MIDAKLSGENLDNGKFLQRATKLIKNLNVYSI